MEEVAQIKSQYGTGTVWSVVNWNETLSDHKDQETNQTHQMLIYFLKLCELCIYIDSFINQHMQNILC